MQFLESSMIGLRSAICVLNSPDSELQFVLFPMVHIGDPSFYSGVHERLNECSHIVYESAKSYRSTLLTYSYRFITKRQDLGLVSQKDALSLSGLDATLIHGDLSSSELSHRWNKLSFLYKVVVPLVGPLYGIYKFLTATRASLAKNHSVESVKSNREIDNSDTDFSKLLIDGRDKKLIATIEETINGNYGSAKKVAILFGASHMRVVTCYLLEKHNYRVVDSQWMQVM